MKKSKTFNLDAVSLWLVRIAVFLALLAFVFPLILTQFSVVDFTETGQIGDTIGGISSPFIGLASIAVMFLAFYVQFKANEMMQKQFEKNKFETQFFQMLKTHKENSKIIIDENPPKGFETLVEETNKRNNDFDTISRIKNDIEICRDVSRAVSKSRADEEEVSKKDIFRGIYSTHIWKDSFGHYYRHLFLMVKFVVNSELTYEKKRDYLRILRASLSTSEQVFLYYNWLSGYGKQWENDTNRFFTDYRMIHNIKNDAILQDFKIKEMHPFKELLENGNYRKEKNTSGKEREDDDLFELIQHNSNSSVAHTPPKK